MNELIYFLGGALFVPLTIFVVRFVMGPPEPRAEADPECIHCRGIGYDASGYNCTCVREAK